MASASSLSCTAVRVAKGGGGTVVAVAAAEDGEGDDGDWGTSCSDEGGALDLTGVLTPCGPLAISASTSLMSLSSSLKLAEEEADPEEADREGKEDRGAGAAVEEDTRKDSSSSSPTEDRCWEMGGAATCNFPNIWPDCSSFFWRNVYSYQEV